MYALVGYGISNKELCKVLRQLGHNVFVSEIRLLNLEEKTELESLGVEYEEGQNSDAILRADRIVVSPSVKPDHPVVSKADEKVLTDLDVILALKKPKVVIGITGTNGKTTTCSMLTHALKKAGKSVECLGNIGNPIAKLVEKDIDYLVLELSSFQLFWSRKLPIDIGVITNIKPNHLDWHPSFEHYYRSKLKLFDFSSIRVYNSQDPLLSSLAMSYDNTVGFDRIKANKQEKTIELEGKLYPFSNANLYTTQNLWNLSAVVQVLRIIGFQISEALKLLEDFTPPKHRMQFVAEINGVSFYNDSKSTSAAATIEALENFEDKKVVLILTGKGKNENYEPLINKICEKAKAVVMFGEMASLIKDLIEKANVQSKIVENMDQAVKEAFSMAEPGEVVLLSPAGASFDLYKNYTERGEHFERVVKSLLGG
ncbi:UDP-N-acetylmuramoyl-L-alanine--D-glutamate ligase [Pseudothermotoga thermarum]|uniref:UDP-N-acetylmuramoyl-L-alanine--D-glutamate ligase n=1 Tax=Pseudothermotoga thermarum TaxID=119394 RepID=UPI001FE11E3B|nr:UDP-N-acetylmuramoyl-L-alanine--D-glutamate ligase [Pseudothermotoga thermarum]